MSKTYSGYFIKIVGKQSEVFSKYHEEGWKYTGIIPDVSLDIRPSEIALISTRSDAITYICLLRKQGRVATRMCKVEYSNIIKLETPLLLKNTTDKLGNRYHHHFIKVINQDLMRIPPKTWSGLLENLKTEHQDIYNSIKILEKLRNFRSIKYSEQGTNIFAQEKDAVNMVLRFAGFDTQVLKEWLPPDDKKAPFLTGLSNVRLREDQMINHDSIIFGDWKPENHDKIGIVTFTNKGEKITIMNVNRTPIEETLGVDLIYYHHRYKAFILVQYKRMKLEESEKAEDVKGENNEDIPKALRKYWVYRPIDSSYMKEINQMHQFESVAIMKDKISHLEDYRYNPQAFYLKLCPSETLDTNSDSMIHGMYFPLDYWERLLSSEETTGPRDGKSISYKNCGRHLNNTLFISLVQSGWIGSREITSEQLTNIINEVLSKGRAIVLAKVEKEQDS